MHETHAKRKHNQIFVQHMTESDIIEGCLKQKRQAQKALYDQYGNALLGICRRYLKNEMEAEDVFVEGMYKIMTKIKQFNNNGSLYGWMKRIMINESLMALRKKKMKFEEIENVAHTLESQSLSIEEKLYAMDIKELMDELPTGYRTVINLYLIEGYKHREIAEILDISINTSKSQLALAKKKMISMIEARSSSKKHERK